MLFAVWLKTTTCMPVWQFIICYVLDPYSFASINLKVFFFGKSHFIGIMLAKFLDVAGFLLGARTHSGPLSWAFLRSPPWDLLQAWCSGWIIPLSHNGWFTKAPVGHLDRSWTRWSLQVVGYLLVNWASWFPYLEIFLTSLWIVRWELLGANL